MQKRLLHYEHPSQPLISRRAFVLRVMWHVGAGEAALAISLLVGILGYHFLEGFSWVDSLLNASMILGGMGPVNPLVTAAGKVFASIYAIFSGVVFLVVAGVMMAPVAHRVLHRINLDVSDK